LGVWPLEARRMPGNSLPVRSLGYTGDKAGRQGRRRSRFCPVGEGIPAPSRGSQLRVNLSIDPAVHSHEGDYRAPPMIARR
jgi:hypothetical protein